MVSRFSTNIRVHACVQVRARACESIFTGSKVSSSLCSAKIGIQRRLKVLAVLLERRFSVEVVHLQFKRPIIVEVLFLEAFGHIPVWSQTYILQLIQIKIFLGDNVRQVWFVEAFNPVQTSKRRPTQAAIASTRR